MHTATLRYIVRFVITTVVGTVLTLCLISAFRLAHVHRSLENAAQYAGAGRMDRVERELRLADGWAPAYPSLAGPVQRLYRAAVAQAGLPSPVPPAPPRTLAARLPLLEKALIPADLLIHAFYNRLWRSSRIQAADAYAATAVSLPVSALADRPAVAMQGTSRPTGDRVPPLDKFLPAERPEPPEVTFPVAGALPPPVLDEAPAPPPEPASAREAVWGVVINPDTPVYNPAGARVRSVPAGSLVDVLRLQTVASGEVVGCSIWSRVGNFQNVILRRGDVELYFGTLLSETTRQMRELASRRAELTAAIEARRKSLAEGGDGRNPHQEDYRSLLVEYKAMDDEAVKRKAEFETASGGRRMELANRLRVLKNDQARLMPRYHELKQKKEDWEQRNRERRTSTDPDNDPELLQMRQQLDELNEQLRDL